MIHLGCVAEHPIHISVSEVEIKPTDITWTARIYKDDLLAGMYGKKANIDMLGEPAKIKSDILAYLTSNVSIHIDSKPLTWTLVDIQPDPEAIWVTMISNVDQRPGIPLMVRNHILIDLYYDQKNVVNLTWNMGKKNLVFEKGDDQKTIVL